MAKAQATRKTIPSQGRAPSLEVAAPVSPVDAMSARLLGTAVEAMDLVVVAIGERLGYYEALDGHTLNPPQLAAATGTNVRYVREWLEHQAVAGYVVLTRGARGEEHSYRLAPGVAEVLARPGTLSSMAPLTRQVAAALAQWTRVVEGARTGHGLGWAAYGREMREGQNDRNGPQLRELLADDWLPAALPHVHRRLVAGVPMRVADIGCGGGWAAIALAEAFPAITVDGYDTDPPTVVLARDNVAAAGLQDRVRIIEDSPVHATAESEYDLAVSFDCVHELAQPIDVLAAVHRMLRFDGAALVADLAGAEELHADGDPLQRALYGLSLLVCLPDAMAGGAVDATGAVIRPFTMNLYGRSAGFSNVEVVPIEHDLWRFYRLKP